jgi:hypothetical protein
MSAVVWLPPATSPAQYLAPSRSLDASEASEPKPRDFCFRVKAEVTEVQPER